MVKFLQNVPETIKGIGLMLFGAILFMYGIGILRTRLDMILIIAGVILFVYGFMIVNGPKKLSKIMSELNKSDSNKRS